MKTSARLWLLLVLLPLAACQDINLQVKIIAEDPIAYETALRAVDSWGILGFVNDEKGRPVTIERVPNLRTPDRYMNQLNGRTDREHDLIQVDATYTGDPLLHIIMHELGHLLLDLDHLRYDEMGVMADGMYRIGWPTVLTQDDLDLACRQTGLCAKLPEEPITPPQEPAGPIPAAEAPRD